MGQNCNKSDQASAHAGDLDPKWTMVIAYACNWSTPGPILRIHAKTPKNGA